MCIQIYHINEFLFADDLKKAENKLKQYQYSSDIASEIEQLPEKRQRNKPNRYIVTSSSDKEDEAPSKLKPLPRLNISASYSQREAKIGNSILSYYIIIYIQGSKIPPTNHIALFLIKN